MLQRVLLLTSALGLGVARALTMRQSGCSFHMHTQGSLTAPVGQYESGQARASINDTPAGFTLTGNVVRDSQGRGCWWTPPALVLQCDVGQIPEAGFDIGCGGAVSYNGQSTFYRCDTGEDNLQMVYLEPNGSMCDEITLHADGCYLSSCGSSGGGSESIPAGQSSTATAPTASESTYPGGSGSGYPVYPSGGGSGSGTSSASGSPDATGVYPGSESGSALGTQTNGSKSGSGYSTVPIGTGAPTGPGSSSSPSSPTGDQPAGSQPSEPYLSTITVYSTVAAVTETINVCGAGPTGGSGASSDSGIPAPTIPGYPAGTPDTPGGNGGESSVVSAPNYPSGSAPGYTPGPPGQSTVTSPGSPSGPATSPPSSPTAGFPSGPASPSGQPSVTYPNPPSSSPMVSGSTSESAPGSPSGSAPSYPAAGTPSQPPVTSTVISPSSPSVSASASGSPLSSALGYPSAGTPGEVTVTLPSSLSGSAPGSPSPPVPGSPESSAAGSPPGSAPGQSTIPYPNSPSDSAPGSPSASAPGSSAGSDDGSPSSSAPGYPAYTPSAVTITAILSTPTGDSGSPTSTPTGIALGQTDTPAVSSCPGELTGAWEYPHLIIPIDKRAPESVPGTSFFGEVTATKSTAFSFDIPSSDQGKTCTLVFYFPEKSQLETSSYDLSGSDAVVDFARLDAPVTESTSYATLPGIAQSYGQRTVAPGGAYTIDTFACPAGERIAFEMSAPAAGDDSTNLRYFQDWNPCPIGMFITVSE